MNENIKEYLTTEYARLAYTANYVFGYAESGMVYAAMVEDADEILPYVTCLDRASSKNGGTYSLKYKPTKAIAAILRTYASKVFAVCSVEYLENLNRENRQNRGQIFEAMVAEILGAETPKAKNAKFTDCGDIIVNNRHYQVKYAKATFTDERTLKNLSGRA